MNFVWILVPATAAVLLSPLITKSLSMEQVDKAVIEFDSAIGDFPVLLERRKLDSGYLSSALTTRVHLKEFLPELKQELCIDLLTEISHSFTDVLTGNITSTRTTILPLNEQGSECGVKGIFENYKELKDFYDSNYGGKSPFVINASYSFLGSPEGSFTILPFKIDIPNSKDYSGPVIISSQQLTGDIKASNNLEAFTFNMDWEGFETVLPIESAPFEMKLGHLSLEGDQYIAYENIWLGNVNQTFSDLNIVTVDAGKVNKFELPEIVLNSKAYEDEQGVQSESLLKINNINRSLGDFVLDLDIKNIDPKALSAITHLLEDVLPSLEVGEALTEIQINELFLHGKSLIAKALLNINSLQYTVNNSVISIDGSFNAQRAANLSLQEIISSPMGIIKMLFLELNGTVDKNFGDAVSDTYAKYIVSSKGLPDDQVATVRENTKAMINNQISGILAMGYLVGQGNTYTSSIKLADAVASINGEVVQIPFPQR
jgi:uncharacterized protein YdgA (DUF945 family)